MKDFLKKIMTGGTAEPPKDCEQTFINQFEGAKNVEWTKRGSSFEAVFYKENIEYIALFDADGNLIKYKMYLSKDLLPALIKHDIESRGEIMNVVLINEGNDIVYEIIVRDTSMKRYLLLVSQLGKVIDENPLLFNEN